jgi:hypothetical protein
LSYDIFGEHGYVDGGPNINGLRAFRSEVSQRANRGRFPHIEAFLEDRCSSKPRLLARECRALAPTIKNVDVRFTCEELAKAAMRSGRVVKLSDGVS